MLKIIVAFLFLENYVFLFRFLRVLNHQLDLDFHNGSHAIFKLLLRDDRKYRSVDDLINRRS